METEKKFGKNKRGDNKMESTGIVRRIDDLGRVVIPREIRRNLNIREGDPLEIFTDSSEKAVCFKPYLPYSEPWRLLENTAEAMRDSRDFHEFAAEVYAIADKIKKSARSQ